MAIVFDSDAGTITGISVGGLPDGVVDAGTLANNAVTEAKIASMAVVTAKLNDDAVTNAKMANDAITEHELAGSAVVTAAINDDAITAAKLASGVGGKVVQMNNKASAATTFNNGSGTVTLDTLAFSNAHTSGNGVFIGYPIQTYTTSASSDDAWLYFKVFDGSTELDSQGRYYWASGAVGYNNMYACCVFPSISSTATLTVKITAATNSSFQQVMNGQDNARAFFIQEIA